MRETQETVAGKAAYFSSGDYAGPIRRVVILAIDLVALFVIVCGITLVLALLDPAHPPEQLAGEMLLLLMSAGYVYLTLVQRSRIGTLGYLLMGVRIVDIEGRRPSLLQMTVRLIPMLPVPWSLLFDLGWMLDDPGRQTLRDKWAGTFVVRRKARPLGWTTVIYKRICFAGLHLVFPEVGRRDISAVPPMAGGPPSAGKIGAS
jgi:uncharacterized RDD family membrane protein YckC